MADPARQWLETDGDGRHSREKPLSGMAVKTLSKIQLETVLLAYLMREPQTGRDLMDNIHRDSGVRFSPGRVYPTLAGLVKQGLLTPVRGTRQIVYHPVDRARLQRCVETRLDESASLIEFVKSLYRVAMERR
jgi:sugar-specific transcriptional regulator TrmB